MKNMKRRRFQQHSYPLYWTLSLSAMLILTVLTITGSLFLLQTGPFAHAASTPRIPHHQPFSMLLAHPHYWYGGAAAMGMQLACQSPTANARCYTPQQIQNAYDIAPFTAAGITGKGHTIVIVDAFQSPTIRHDLAMFDRIFGLNDPTLRIFAPDGLAPFNPKDPAQVSWAAEITLDVEWAHAVAPGASIDLVLSNPTKNANAANTLSGFLLNILHATAFAVQHNLGDVISQSFGGDEACVSSQALRVQHQVFQAATAKGITLLAASGDRGAAEINCAFTSFAKAVSTPASDPLVTAVGGTTLNASMATGNYMSEAAWVGSGGGFSTVFARPTFQQGVQGITVNRRGVPDIAYNGDPRSGVLVIWSSSGQGKDLAVVFGGTSAGSPQWAGITTLLNQAIGKRVGFLNSLLYRIGKSAAAPQIFHDITSGANTFMGKDVNGALVTINGFTAQKGWDPVTGWGTPDVTHLIQLVSQG